MQIIINRATQTKQKVGKQTTATNINRQIQTNETTTAQTIVGGMPQENRNTKKQKANNNEQTKQTTNTKVNKQHKQQI